MDPSKYAPQPIPTIDNFQSLWTAWDLATKTMIPREELLSKPIKLRNALIFYFGHIPTFFGGFLELLIMFAADFLVNQISI